MIAGPSIKFTVLESVTRLSKRYSLASDGKSVIKESFTQLYEERHRLRIDAGAQLGALTAAPSKATQVIGQARWSSRRISSKISLTSLMSGFEDFKIACAVSVLVKIAPSGWLIS